MDVHDKKTRSYNMSRIRGKDTIPELKVRKYLFRQGYRFRKNDRRLPGIPDVVLPRYRTVIFINGCYWHRHPGCRYTTTPSSNKEFWEAKFATNVANDRRHYDQLEQNGWFVIVLWECEIKYHFEDTMNRLTHELSANYVALATCSEGDE